MHRTVLLFLTVCSIGCGDKDNDSAESIGTSGTSGGSSTADLAWYATCGDPACSGYSGPYEGVATCTDQAEGVTCTPEGDTCDLQNDCNAFMVCAAEDPKAQPGGCPVSRRSTKTAIDYLDATERDAARQRLLDTRLATWRYRWDAPERRPRLGFLIDDQPDSPAVAQDGQHVDLYGYTSLTVAAVQAQNEELLQLRAELAQTRAELDALKAAVEALQATE